MVKWCKIHGKQLDSSPNYHMNYPPCEPTILCIFPKKLKIGIQKFIHECS